MVATYLGYVCKLRLADATPVAARHCMLCLVAPFPPPLSTPSLIEQWAPEIEYFCPGAPFVLVGCKLDLRGDKDHAAYLAATGQKLVPRAEGEACAAKIGAYGYAECSAKTGVSATPVARQWMVANASPCLRSALRKKRKKRKGTFF
jgi:GTPase SAR1 family protein